MLFKKVVLFLVGVVFFYGCTTKEYTEEKSAYILFKTPTFKYADMGFVYENEDEVKAEIYSNGQAVMSLRITHSAVCMSALECMGADEFNQKVLSAHYPQGILEHIFKGEPIFEGAAIERKGNTFTQQLKKEGKYTIKYSVLKNQITFHDRMNAIKIMIKRF
ncbi:MAG: hypothetical protein RLZZ428_349 [Pseudomonadota bacterium]